MKYIYGHLVGLWTKCLKIYGATGRDRNTLLLVRMRLLASALCARFSLISSFFCFWIDWRVPRWRTMGKQTITCEDCGIKWVIVKKQIS
jgi:hypothetical protein